MESLIDKLVNCFDHRLASPFYNDYTANENSTSQAHDEVMSSAAQKSSITRVISVQTDKTWRRILLIIINEVERNINAKTSLEYLKEVC